MLPDDFRNHWIQNFIYETYFYGRLTKLPQAMCDSRLTKSDVVTKLYNNPHEAYTSSSRRQVSSETYIDLYKYTTHRGKHIKEYFVKFNTMIQSYEIEYPRIGTIRYPDWAHTMAAMWNLEKMTNIEAKY